MKVFISPSSKFKSSGDWNRHATDRLNLAYRRSVAELFNIIVHAWPVGDPSRWKNPNRAPKGYVGGRSRASWHMSQGSSVTIVQSVSSSYKIPSPEVNGLTLGDRKVFITNNIAYASRLNDGWSKQMPKGTIQAAIRRIASL